MKARFVIELANSDYPELGWCLSIIDARGVDTAIVFFPTRAAAREWAKKNKDVL